MTPPPADEPKPELPAEPRIATEVQVMFFDTDAAAVVHNIAYLRFIETTRTLLAGALGMSLPEMARSQQFPVVVRTEIDYKRPAVLGDTLVIEGWLERLERIRFWCGFTIRRKGGDGTVLVHCRQMLALVQMPAGKPVRMSDEWITRYSHLRVGKPSEEAASSAKYGGLVG